ncbi:hypothetical protein ATERTT37_004738 [Aspergillus terreus]
MLDNPAADIIDRTISSSETEAGEHSKNEGNISIDSASEDSVTEVGGNKQLDLYSDDAEDPQSEDK